MTTDLFGKRPRRKPRVMMRVIDAGTEAQEFECAQCGYSDWYEALPVSQAKRGIPCPRCNQKGEA